jgi:hypothetical protein
MDALHDNSFRTWVKLGTNHESLIPQYVLDYKLPDEKMASEIENELFADPARRLFPIDSPAATWLSNAYFAKHAADGDLPYCDDEASCVSEQLMKAAVTYGVAEDCRKIVEAMKQAMVKEASDPDADYGWVIRDADTGQVIKRRYPMFDETGVKKASAYFTENRQKYPVGLRRHIARRIMDKAAEYKLGYDRLDGAVLREAGYGIPRKDVLMEEILERAHLVKDAEDADAAVLLLNVNEMLAGMPDTEIGQNLDKIAEVMDAFDHVAGLTRHYGTKILMPADILFDVNLDKAAEAVEDAICLKQHMFSLNKLAELQPSVFADVLGDDFVGFITDDDGNVSRTKMADALSSLPKPDKAALEEHLARLYS